MIKSPILVITGVIIPFKPIILFPLIIYPDNSPVPVEKLLSLVVIFPDELIRNLSKPLVLKIISFAFIVLIFKLALLLKFVVFIVPNPTSKLVMGLVIPIPTLPFLLIIKFKFELLS